MEYRSRNQTSRDELREEALLRCAIRMEKQNQTNNSCLFIQLLNKPNSPNSKYCHLFHLVHVPFFPFNKSNTQLITVFTHSDIFFIYLLSQFLFHSYCQNMAGCNLRKLHKTIHLILLIALQQALTPSCKMRTTKAQRLGNLLKTSLVNGRGMI